MSIKRLIVTAVVAAPLAAAAVAFALARPDCSTELPAALPHPAETHDLASHLYGPTVVASSADLSAFHHPAFVVDGLTANEPKVAKWTSRKDDRAPWLEIRFRGAHDVERIAFRFAGARERAAWSMRDYDVRCLGAPAAKVEIRGNRSATPSHELLCRGATGVRVDFRPGRDDVARVYEVEVTGR